MPKTKKKPFTDVDFNTEYPAKRVAEHEVFMSFNGDDDAVAFHDWWHEEGAVYFQSWLDRRNPEDSP